MKNKKIVKLFALILALFPFAALAQNPPNQQALGGWTLPTGFGLPGEGMGTGGSTIFGIVNNFALWILAILGIVGIIGFVISGIMYLVSAGNEDMIRKAKSAMVASIIGVIVGLAGYVLIQAIDTALNANGLF